MTSQTLSNPSLSEAGLHQHNIRLDGRRTSVRLEPEIWQALCDIATRERCSVHTLCRLVKAKKRATSSLTAAIRVFVMLYFRAAATEEGHRQVGHGHLAVRQRLSKAA